MSSEKIALAACSGMSPYGLVARVTSADTVNEAENTISICMGATAADREGFRNLIKKYPIIAINGCDGNCTTKILNQKGVTPAKILKGLFMYFSSLDYLSLKYMNNPLYYITIKFYLLIFYYLYIST